MRPHKAATTEKYALKSNGAALSLVYNHYGSRHFFCNITFVSYY